jgi:hypothetical protein
MNKITLLLITIILIHWNTNGQTATAPSGTGNSGDPYLIATLDNLYWVTQNSASWTSYFKQTANIDATSTSTWDSGNGFSPIGNSTTQFSGNYNGQGHIISNLFINRPTVDYIGLFGRTGTVTLANIILTNVNITGRNYVGALIGYASSITVSYCSSSGSLYGGIDGSLNGMVGGLLGYIGGGTISYSYSNCNVTGPKRAGGFLGASNNLNINCCYATGNILINGTYNNTYAGGFSGEFDSSVTGIVLNNSYATGSVTNSSTGGLSYAGGFSGFEGGSTVVTVQNSYCTGAVSAVNTPRGFVARTLGSPVNTNCFFDTQTTGQAVAGNAGITGKTTVDMKITATFTGAGWDFVGETTNGTNNYWDRTDGINSGYPVLTFVMPAPPIAWTGATSTNWNTASNWSTTVVPTSANDITIPSTANNPIITSSATCKGLKIESGAILTINPTYPLTINNNLENNGSLIVKSSASGDGSLLISGTLTGSGSYNVERYLAANKWHLVSSPITAGLSGVFLNIWLRAYDEATNTFGAYIVPTTIPMPTGQGFSVWTNTANEIRTFSGLINHGNVTPSVQLTGAAGPSTGWNLIGNPYPSSIDWNAASGWTKTNIGSTIYVWNNNQYATWNGSVGTNGGTQNIAMEQGFFVQATAAGAGISMNNSVRVHNSVTYMKTVNEEPADIIRVKANINDNSDETVIAINNNGSDNFNFETDAVKLPGSTNSPQMHTTKSDNSPLAINTQSAAENVVGKYVYIDYAETGTHQLLFTHTLTGTYIPRLYDNVAHTVVEPNTPYTFNATVGDASSRFQFIESLPLSINSPDNMNLTIWESNKMLYIVNPSDENIKQIRIYGTDGKLVHQGNQPATDLKSLSSGVYIVKVITTTKTQIKKIAIK